MSVVLAGFLTGLSLIVAIGARNAYVLRLGLMRTHVGLAVAVCAVSDAVLILAGTAGVGALVESSPVALRLVSWVGALYLGVYALMAFRRALRTEVLMPSAETAPGRRAVLLAVVAFTWLNPHVYLDTVLLLGSIGSQYGPDRWWFALGAAIASVGWFTGLGFGARAAARLMSRPVTWRVLDVIIGLVMTTIAVSLVRGTLG